MSMNRTTSLPEFDMKPEELSPPDASRPCYNLIVRVFLQLAEVQGSIVRESKANIESRDIAAVQRLQDRMFEIRGSMTEVRGPSMRLKRILFWNSNLIQMQVSHVIEDCFQGELIGLDFVYNSVMTTILKLHPNVMEDSSLYHQLLSYARTSLTSLLDMMNHATNLVECDASRDSIPW
jgi:hypothetical protein